MIRLHDSAVRVRLGVSEQAIRGVRVQRRRPGGGDAIRQDDGQIPKPLEEGAQERQKGQEKVPRFPNHQVHVPPVL